MSIKDDELSAYAPIRQRGMLWWKYGQVAAKDGHVNAEGMMSGQLPSMIEQYLVRLYISSFADTVRGQENASTLIGVHLAKTLMLRHWVPMVAQYELCGRQIFDLHDSLVEMLAETDLGECTLENWNAPYEAFYVRFGKQESMSLPFDGDEREYLDGAFVARTPFDEMGYRLKIGFTTVKENSKGVMLPGYFIDFQPEELKLTVPEAIDAALKRKMAEYDEDDAADGNEQNRAINSYRRQEAEDSAELLKAGATLLVNALFYLEGLGSSSPEPGPGRDTPPERVARWYQMDSKRRRKEKSALSADSYAIVRLVGSEVADGVRRGAGGSLRTHWRRGHWRLQRYGEGLSQCKRIWIKPVMVGSDQMGDPSPPPGHVYMTGTSAIH